MIPQVNNTNHSLKQELDDTQHKRPDNDRAPRMPLRRQGCFVEESTDFAYSSRIFQSSFETWSAYLSSDSDDSFTTPQPDSATTPNKRIRCKGGPHRKVRFSDSKPIVFNYDKPTDREKALMYYNAMDYQRMIVEHYIEQLQTKIASDVDGMFEAP